VIFSVNVLEHIPTLERALEGMLGVLAPGGVMRHTCPNYAVPYEPHYGIPLVPLKPSFTGAVIPSIARQQLWQSINFVSYDRIVCFCRTHALECRFDEGLLADAFNRIDRDPAFRARRGATLRLGHRLLRATRLLSLLALLPPRWATPMAFTCWRKGEGPPMKTPRGHSASAW
jgi:SAM-dependent methyltransferase